MLPFVGVHCMAYGAAVVTGLPAGASTPHLSSLPLAAAPCYAGAPVLSVSDMDAVLEYLHKEHQALEAERQTLAARQQQKPPAAAEPSPRPPVPPGLQRSASQPLAISGPSATRSSQQGTEAAAMEVDAKPSSRRALLAASAEPQQVASAFGAAAMSGPVPAPAVLAASPPCKPPVAPALAAAPGPLVLFEQPCEQGAAPAGEPPLLPPQRPEHRGKLVVCLDLDGTLVSTFTPKRAPLLPSTAVSYVVGRGGKLNPGGVFVVERPGLREFFARISPVAEVSAAQGGAGLSGYPVCLSSLGDTQLGQGRTLLQSPALAVRQHAGWRAATAAPALRKEGEHPASHLATKRSACSHTAAPLDQSFLFTLPLFPSSPLSRRAHPCSPAGGAVHSWAGGLCQAHLRRAGVAVRRCVHTPPVPPCVRA